VPVEAVEEWIPVLLGQPELTPDIASAIVQLGARCEDPQRDINESLRARAIKKLSQSGTSERLIEGLRVYVPPAPSDALRIFGESLPEGLRIVV
jgi:hypothetical protein